MTPRQRRTGADQTLQVFVCLPFRSESCADLVGKLDSSTVKKLRYHACLWSMFWCFLITIRHGGRLSRIHEVSRVLLMDKEVSKPVACFCIQRHGLEIMVVVSLRLEVMTTSAWVDGVSTLSGLCDALLNLHKEKVG